MNFEVLNAYKDIEDLDYQHRKMLLNSFLQLNRLENNEITSEQYYLYMREHIIRQELLKVVSNAVIAGLGMDEINQTLEKEKDLI